LAYYSTLKMEAVEETTGWKRFSECCGHLWSVEIGRAIAQTVSRWLPTAAARVQTQDRSCGICGRQSGTGAGFLRVLRIPLPILIQPTAPHSSSIIRCWYNRLISFKWTQVSHRPKKSVKISDTTVITLVPSGVYKRVNKSIHQSNPVYSHTPKIRDSMLWESGMDSSVPE
jgi:hypothetical protein